MRNILQYPITDQEIIETLERALEAERAKELIGGIEMICLNRAIERVKKYPEIPRS